MSRRRPYTPTQADTYLEALRATGGDAYRCHPTRDGHWTARCPLCGHRGLVVQEHARGGRVSLYCAFGCDEDAVKQQLMFPERCYECGAVQGQADDLGRLAGEATRIAASCLQLVREIIADPVDEALAA